MVAQDEVNDPNPAINATCLPNDGGCGGRVSSRAVTKKFDFRRKHFLTIKTDRSAAPDERLGSDRWGHCEGYRVFFLGRC